MNNRENNSETRNLFGDLKLAELLFDQVPGVLFFVKDARARYVGIGQSIVQRCSATSKSEVLGKTAREIYPSPLGDLYYEQDMHVLNTGEEIRGQLDLHFLPDGSRGWCMTDKFPIFSPDGEVVGLAGLSRDLHGPGETGDDFEKIANAVNQIHNRFHESLRIGDLADSCGLSVAKFERFMMKIFQLTPTQYLTKTRIEAAVKLLTESENGDNVCMVQLRRGLGFTLEPNDRRWRCTDRLTQDLHGHGAFQRPLPGFIDGSHPAAPDFTTELEVSEDR